MSEDKDNIVDFAQAIQRTRDVLDGQVRVLRHLLLTRAEAESLFDLNPNWLRNLPTGATFISPRQDKVQLID